MAWASPSQYPPSSHKVSITSVRKSFSEFIMDTPYSMHPNARLVMWYSLVCLLRLPNSFLNRRLIMRIALAKGVPFFKKDMIVDKGNALPSPRYPFANVIGGEICFAIIDRLCPYLNWRCATFQRGSVLCKDGGSLLRSFAF
jgi:hypothetical protein